LKLQQTYALALDGELPGVKNNRFLSPEHLEALRFTAEKAKELGLRMDMTLGSGWPYGGPQISRERSRRRLHASAPVSVSAGQTSVDLSRDAKERDAGELSRRCSAR
jgi:hypothetical protein